MQPEELQMRLLKLGANTPLSTLRRWASEGLVHKPVQYYKPRKKRVGRPESKETEAHPGRFSYWTEESLEAAAAVWAIRYLARPVDSTEDNLLSIKETSQKDVSKSDIVQGQQMARNLHTLLYTDCKEATSRFRAYLWPQGFSSEEGYKGKKLYFGKDRLFSLIPVCVAVFEKVRHHITLNVPINITYEWAIREDGEGAFAGIHIQRQYVYESDIKLQITHLRPCENGYSKDYGFPHGEEYTNGFVEEFWLRGTELGQRFKPSPFGDIPSEFYKDEKYADYWAKDPYGWADYAAEPYYEDTE